MRLHLIRRKKGPKQKNLDRLFLQSAPGAAVVFQMSGGAGLLSAASAWLGLLLITLTIKLKELKPNV